VIKGLVKRYRGDSIRLLTGLLFASTCCFAQQMNAKDDLCQSSVTTSEMTNCFAIALKKADSELNGYYQRIPTVVDRDGLAKLKTAQRLWIQFRDANCDAEYELYSEGTAAPMVKLACLEAMTRHRTEELHRIYGSKLENGGK
jgi:uncharacterized protein YecT (DUF1311 family)